jgi:hypothetical protein
MSGDARAEPPLALLNSSAGVAGGAARMSRWKRGGPLALVDSSGGRSWGAARMCGGGSAVARPGRLLGRRSGRGSWYDGR